MEQYIRVSGCRTCVTVSVCKSGLMVPNTRVDGAITRPRGGEFSGMPMGTSLTVSGRRIKLMDSEPIHMSMEPNTRVNGFLICSMDKVERSGRTVAAMRAFTWRG